MNEPTDVDRCMWERDQLAAELTSLRAQLDEAVLQLVHVTPLLTRGQKKRWVERVRVAKQHASSRAGQGSSSR